MRSRATARTMRSRTTAMLLPAACLAAWACEAKGDEFDLRNGGKLLGTLVEGPQPGKPGSTYKIRTSSGVTVVLVREEVREHRKLRPALEEYEEIKPTFADTAEGQWALAEWCRERDLVTPRKGHLLRTIELDPNHEGARRGLGHVRFDNKWSDPDDLMVSRGYVNYNGRWRLPQEVALLEARRREDLAEKEWFRKLNLWREWIVRGDKRAREARENLAALKDPLALRALKYNLEGESLAQMRLLYIDALAQMNHPTANVLLAQRLLVDTDKEVALTGLDRLAKTKPPEAVAYFVSKLKDKDNIVVCRAGYGLGKIGEPAAVPSLIDALVTKHKYQVNYGPPPGAGSGGNGAMSSTFARGANKGGSSSGGSSFGGGMGGGAMQMGSKVEYVMLPVQNEDVLQALVNITGQNFYFDKILWAKWLAAQKTAGSLDTRRD